MAEDNGASFIPKNTTRVKKPRTSRRIYVFSYISYILFFGTLFAVLATYVYARQVENTRESLQQELAAEQSRFSQDDIAQVRNLEKRLMVADRLLEETNAPSRIFDALESVIADPIRLVNFGYQRQPGNSIVLSFSGAADTFDAVLFQRELMEAVPGLATVSVVDFTYGEVSGANSNDQTTSNKPLVVTFEGTTAASIFPYDPTAADSESEETVTESATTTTTTEATATTTDNTAANE